MKIEIIGKILICILSVYMTWMMFQGVTVASCVADGHTADECKPGFNLETWEISK